MLFFLIPHLKANAEQNLFNQNLNTFSKEEIENITVIINKIRSNEQTCGEQILLPVNNVSWNKQLSFAAKNQAQYLKENNLFSHSGKNNSTVGQRVSSTGYIWKKVGENIAGGIQDIEDVFQKWLESPSHCLILMDKDFIHWGLYKEPGDQTNTFQNYWVLIMGKPLK